MVESAPAEVFARGRLKPALVDEAAEDVEASGDVCPNGTTRPDTPNSKRLDTPKSRRLPPRRAKTEADMKVKLSFKDVASNIMAEARSVHALDEKTQGLPEVRGREKRFWSLPSSELDGHARSFLRFTPALLHYWLCNEELDKIDIERPMAKRFHAALLLIDVSGFTKMSVTLGAELTRKHTSKFFDKIIHCINHHGGDVFKFLGDALLVAWPTTYPAVDFDRQQIAHAAATCAAQVMKTLNGYSINDAIKLTLHGGLAIGDIWAHDVGNAYRREFLIGGSVLAEMGETESEAASGQLVMTGGFAGLLPKDAALVHNESGTVQLDLDKFSVCREGLQSLISSHSAVQFNAQNCKIHKTLASCESLLESHVAYACREHVTESMLRTLGEIRYVTTLFLALDALTPHLASGNVEKVQSSFLVITEAVEINGGALRQFVLDDKGVVAICAWGLPSAAHGSDQDADRAIQCAIQILDRLHEMWLLDGDMESGIGGPHIGIAAGEVYVGLIGALQRCEYAMVGPSVNLSARLMGKAAPWQVLIERSVRSHALASDRSWNFKEHPAVQAKGYDEKVPVYEPLETPETPSLGFDHTLTSSTTRARRQISQGDRTALGEFCEKWDSMDAQVQIIGKVCAVLAQGPDGICDFPLLALVTIADKLNLADYMEVKHAMIQLKTSQIFRLTRGARRGNPSFTFSVDTFHKWVLALLTVENTARVHRLFVTWLEDKVLAAEKAHDPDPVVHKAKLALLHLEVDSKIKYHKERSAAAPEPRLWIFRLFSGVGLDCCVSRNASETPSFRDSCFSSRPTTPKEP